MARSSKLQVAEAKLKAAQDRARRRALGKALAGDLAMQAAYHIWNPGGCCHGDEG